jgi:hypothetical protein
MDISYGSNAENPCKNIFASDQAVIKERFTRLWTQIICEKENDITNKNNVQTNRFQI